MDVVARLDYRKVREIGAGKGMNSSVFEALDRMGRTVAVKEIPKADLDKHGISDYFQEAKILFESRHDHVVPIYTACETADEVVLLMPLFGRGSLGDRIATAPLGLREVLDVGHGTLHGISRIHVAGYLHFDLKPSNVLFDDLGRPVVADFGQSRMLGPLGVAARPPMYWFGYPPEVFNYGGGVVQSDVYQVGLTLYRAVNGDPFFKDGLARQVGKHGGDLRGCVACGELVDPGKFLPHVPQALRKVIRTALAVDPVERYATAADFSDALARVDAGNDWKVEPLADGGMRWTALRRDQPALVVERIAAGRSDRWDTRVYTDGNGTRRAKGRKDFWRAELTAKQANEHLRRGVFPNL
jgi:serine/threonine protein kinase